MDITDPKVIKFLTESYAAESKLRVRWFNVNSKKLYKAAGGGKELKNISVADVITTSILPGIEAITISHKESEVNRRQIPVHDVKEIRGIDKLRKTHTIKDVGLAPDPDPRLDRPDTDLSLDPIMRPPAAADVEIFYKSMPEYGRLKYLQRRTKLSPEDKYYFNECTSWDYGWRLRDSRLTDMAQQGPRLGRYCAMARDASSRSGPQPDPPDYNPPASMQHFFCVD